MASITGNPVSSAAFLFHPFMLPAISPCIFFISSDGHMSVVNLSTSTSTILEMMKMISFTAIQSLNLLEGLHIFIFVCGDWLVIILIIIICIFFHIADLEYALSIQ
ncbi:hypothetical protein ACJX0J_020219, partial [Zea mays]